MRLERFTVAHLQRMDVQEAQRYLRPHMNWEVAKSLEGEWGLAAIAEDGRVLACGGLVPLGGSRAVLWSYLDGAIGRHMIWLTRVVQRLVDDSPFKRVEAQVDTEFLAGHRWMRLLGFTLETPCKIAYRVDGGDVAEYVRLR